MVIFNTLKSEMKKITLTSDFTVYDAITELTQEDQTLMERAIGARAQAYAPYSNFSVGAAILLDDQTVVLGNNQENAAYPSGLCAERVALFSAGANHPNKTILKIAISASSSANPVAEPVAPCGACRQSIAEYEVKQEQEIAIFFMGETGAIIQTNSLKNLLPMGFDKKLL